MKLFMRDPVIAKLEQCLKPAVEAVGYIWWGCLLIPHKYAVLLRVYIDQAGGVSVEDCVRASHQISAVLSVGSILTGNYTLEVSSPGLDRFLFTVRQYEQYKGHKVKLRLVVPREGQRNFQGIIQHIDVKKDEVTIAVENNHHSEKKNFRCDEIERANLVPVFGD